MFFCTQPLDAPCRELFIRKYIQNRRIPLGLTANWFFVCPYRMSNPAVGNFGNFGQIWTKFGCFFSKWTSSGQNQTDGAWWLFLIRQFYTLKQPETHFLRILTIWGARFPSVVYPLLRFPHVLMYATNYAVTPACWEHVAVCCIQIIITLPSNWLSICLRIMFRLFVVLLYRPKRNIAKTRTFCSWSFLMVPASQLAGVGFVGRYSRSSRLCTGTTYYI